jgi:transcription-repair coupling factor (superfamily II helicase)
VDDTLGIALVTAAVFQQQPQFIQIITTNLYNAQQVYDVLTSLVGETHCLFYPVDELLRANTIANNKEMLAQRLYVMSRLLGKKPVILITHAAGALRYVPNPEYFDKLKISIKIGMTIPLIHIKKLLTASGYQRVNKVDASLQFAIRGDILDVSSVNLPHPVRIEFFGDEIESIRYFDLANQTSFESLHQVEILPASDILWTPEERQEIPNKIHQQLHQDQQYLEASTFQTLSDQVQLDIEAIQEFRITSQHYRYYGFSQRHHYSILQYAPTALTIIANQTQLESAGQLLFEEGVTFFHELSSQGKQISHLQMYQPLSQVLSPLHHIVINQEFITNPKVHLSVRSLASASAGPTRISAFLTQVVNTYDRLLFALSTPQQLENIEEQLRSLHIDCLRVDGLVVPDQGVGLTLMNFEEGFELPDFKFACITSKDLYGFHQKTSRYFSRYKEATILSSHEDLTPGDYVVHEYSGIGQYIGIKTIEIDNMHKDYLHIQYAGTDVLYVPLSQFKLVRKFSGKDGATPRLHRLQSKEWEQTKKRIKERVDDLAERLVELYRTRAVTPGFAFPKDDEIQIQFEKQFPYTLTPDQQRSVEDIKADMEKPFPMDRLLCGDVGFGKTEVAFRAAFKAINAHKQVAILCPTTLLARQHYERAIERFATFGINIAIFSRLIPDAKQKSYLESIKRGDIQLIIGTHRLLSQDIHYHDLGLLIVDEEQRFGVDQKERIKEIKTNVDVLTLSATPIPRTLQISLLGIRQLSQINTSPLNRVPIQTYVMRRDPLIIKELIERELGRRGQVYYLHNRVEDIGLVAQKLQQTIKGSRVGIVHGQMDKDDIEDVMIDFYNGNINVLVCTSIIENGIDVSNANLIIIEQAAFFGLAQLYQIKGRVGRGNRIAYAYLLFNDAERLNEQAAKRLKAIQEFTELGSGYKIAQRDLMIRGAGDILGPEQAGFIDTVGLDMYLQLLNEAIEEKKTGIMTPKVTIPPSLMVDAYIPETYAKNEDKVELYQAIENAKNFEELQTIESYIRDLYGRLPEQVQNLLKKRHFDLLTTHPAIGSWQETKAYIDVYGSEDLTQLNRSGTILFSKIQQHLHSIKVHYANRTLRMRLAKTGDWFSTLMELIRAIVSTYDELTNPGVN